MIGGLLKTASLAAITATAFAISGGLAPANAADLGGNCCADLEERIAELEATTVRKGNRKVSVTLSGYVSHHIMHWDDGIRSDTYIGDGGNYGSRFRFRGDAKISPTLTAGFLYEWQANANQLGSMNQGNFGDDLGATGGAVAGGCSVAANGSVTTGSPGCIVLRDSTVWLKHSHWGMVKVGHGSTATDNLVLIDLGGMSGASTPDVALYTGGFRIGGPGAVYANPGGTNITWGSAILGGFESWDTNRRNHVLYETPTHFGFSLQTAIAEDNFWDIALRYAGEHHGFRAAFGIGYRENSEFNLPAGFTGTDVICDTNCNLTEKSVLGSASVLHVATGLFLTGAAGVREFDGILGTSATGYTPADQGFWYLAGGIARNHFGYGNTVLFAEYSQHDDFVNFADADLSGDATVWGLGVVQYIDAAAMELFLTYKNYSADIRELGVNAPTKDLDVVIGGVRVSF